MGLCQVPGADDHFEYLLLLHAMNIKITEEDKMALLVMKCPVTGHINLTTSIEEK